MGILDRLAAQAVEMSNPKSAFPASGIRPDMPSRFGYVTEDLERKPDLGPAAQVKNDPLFHKIQEPVSSNGNAAQETDPVQLNKPKAKNILSNTKIATKALPQSVSHQPKTHQISAKVNNEADLITSPPEEIFVRTRLETTKSHPTTKPSISSYSNILDTENPLSKADQFEATNEIKTKIEEHSTISIPERLQPFIQLFGSNLSTLPPPMQDTDPPLGSGQRSPSPDVVIQIDHIEIQVEKKTSKRPLQREAKKPKLTDLSSYLSDQGRR